MSSTVQYNDATSRKVLNGFRSNFKFRLMLMSRLPMGFLSGMRIKSLNAERCEVTVPYKWLNKNPFKSTFWAVLGMAAEMSSGAMLLVHTFGQKPSIATLVTATSAKYYKKATGKTTFVCESGAAIKAAALKTMATGEGIEVTCPMTGYNDAGEVVAEFSFTWSLKARLPKA